MKRTKTKSIFGALCLFFAISLFSVFLSISFNTVSVSAYSASISTSNSVTLDATVLGDGTSVKAESINVQSDCRAGYNLSIATPSGSNLYAGGDSTNSATFTAVDGTSALNSNNNTNKWGYTLTNNATGSSVFSPLSTTQSTLKTSSQTASQTDINDTFPIYYGIKTDDTVAPGAYRMADNGAIVYYLTMDPSCNVFTVAFNANGGTGTVTNQNIQPGVSTKLTSADTLTAPTGGSYTDAGNHTITGDPDKLWTFWGWNTSIDGTGDWYKDREAVTDLALTNSSITLYAQWAQPTLADLTTSTPGQNKTIDHNTMQDMSAEACWNSDKFTAISTPYGQATLTDSRDGTNRTYTVAKLPDGLCWMTQNLNLGASTAITLTSDDTDLADNTTFTLPASNPTDFATGTGQSNINKATVLNNMTVPDYTVNGTTYTNKINAYYSYAAATADRYTYSKRDTIIVDTSICPKNWDLPTPKQYQDLKTKGSISTYNNTSTSYIGKNAGNEPYYFIYGGYRKAAGDTINTTTFYYPTSYGYLWTSQNYSTGYGSSYYINSSGLSSGSTSYYKYYGLGIRCVTNMDNASAKITFVNTDTGDTQTKIVGLLGENNSVQIQPTNSWSKTGYSIAGWDTNSVGTNVVYTKGETAIISSNITLYTVWKPAYNIQYDGNGADAGVMTNVKHVKTFEGDIFDLFASNYSKTNYGFAGWSFDPNAYPGGSSRIYGPNEAIEAPAGISGETKTLYAVWVASAGNLQDWNGCSNMSIGDVTALKDTRDNNVYTVGKLADENCWMMENLRLDAASSSDSTKAQGFGGVFVSLADSESTNFTNSTASNTLNGDTLYSTANITGSNQSNRFPRYNNTNTSARATAPNCSDQRHMATSAHDSSLNTAIYSYGNYYTWAAAKANTEDLTSVNDSETANTSICPSGWKLPYGNNTGSGNTSGGFYYLGTRLGATTSNETSSRIWRSYPNNYVYSGIINSSSVSRGSTGDYMSGTTSNATGQFEFKLDMKSITPGSFSVSKNRGQPVRCVAKKGLEVKLMLNDGTGRVGGRIYGQTNSTVTLPTALTRADYRFASWNTAADGTGTNYTTSYTLTTTGITLYAQWYPTYTIQYDGNGADAGTMTNVKHINVIEGDVFDLFASNYSKTNYGFAGWSFDPNAYPGGSSRIYGPNEAIEAPPRLLDSAKTLYAIWVASAGNLQGWQGCSSMNVGDVTALKDTRDNNVYTVGKLADENCWMMENLRLDTANSGDNTKAQGFGGVFSGLADPETSHFSTDTTANSLYNTTLITGDYQSYRFPRYNNSNISARTADPNVLDDRSTSTSAHAKALNVATYSYGNYYTWAAAKANTEILNSINASEAANTSICPSGWRLPYGRSTGNGNTSGGFYYLGTRLGATTSNETSSRIWRSYPNNLVLSGRFSGSYSYEQGYKGIFWTSTASDSNQPYPFNQTINYNTVSMSNYAAYSGYSVRCVSSNNLSP